MPWKTLKFVQLTILQYSLYCDSLVPNLQYCLGVPVICYIAIAR